MLAAVDVGVCNDNTVIPLSFHAPEEVSMCSLSGLMALRLCNGSIQDPVRQSHQMSRANGGILLKYSQATLRIQDNSRHGGKQVEKQVG